MDLFNRLKTMRIMLVDDDKWIRGSLKVFFENEGCQLQVFETAEEALEVLANQVYDIILTDYRLPGMDGLKFLGLIKKTHPSTIRILLTAYWSAEVVSIAHEIGIHDFIEKPITTKIIEDSLQRSLGLH